MNKRFFCAVLVCVTLVFGGCAKQETIDETPTSAEQTEEACVIDGVVHLSEGGAFLFSKSNSSENRVEAEYLFKTNSTYIHVRNRGSGNVKVDLSYKDSPDVTILSMELDSGEVRCFSSLAAAYQYRLFFQQNGNAQLLIEVSD